MTAVSSSCAVVSNLDRVKNWEQLVNLPGFAIVCSYVDSAALVQKFCGGHGYMTSKRLQL